MSPNWLARPLPHTRGSYDKNRRKYIDAPPLAIVEFIALPPPVVAKLEDAFEKNCTMCGGVLVRDKRGSVGFEWEVMETVKEPDKTQVLIDPTELSLELTARLFGENMPTIGKIAFDVREFFLAHPLFPDESRSGFAFGRFDGCLSYALELQRTTSCAPVPTPVPPTLSNKIDRSKLSCVLTDYIDPISWPAPTNIKVNMMPFKIGDPKSLPKQYHQYWEIISQITEAELNPDYRERYTDNPDWPSPPVCPENSTIAYLTIDESFVSPGSSQRRSGLHTESPGGTIQDIVAPEIRGYFYWGEGLFASGEAEGGIFMCSNVAGSTLFYDCEVKQEEMGAIPDGDVESLRGEMGEPIINEAGGVYWINDRTPHESLPIQGGGERQYVRIVQSGISVWFSDHNTANPLCDVGKGVMIVEGNKFEEGGLKVKK